MANTLKASRSNIIVGLGTYTHVTASTSMYFVSAVASENPPSSLSIVIQLNGVTKATSLTPAAAQQIVSAQVTLNCAQGDTISVILSSSADIDKQLNTVKTFVVIKQGQ